MSRTREERARARRRRIYATILVLWIVLLVSLCFAGTTEHTEPEVELPKEEPLVVQTIPEPEHDPIYDVEATPNVFDPVRDDVPLDAETQRLLYQACGETGIRYELALAVIWQETDFRNIVGDGGNSIGYMQVQPRWHGDRMERLGVSDLADPYGNFLVGCDYLMELLTRYENTEQALVAYNQGKFKGVVTEYAKNVLNYMNILTMEEF